MTEEVNFLFGEIDAFVRGAESLMERYLSSLGLESDDWPLLFIWRVNLLLDDFFYCIFSAGVLSNGKFLRI